MSRRRADRPAEAPTRPVEQAPTRPAALLVLLIRGYQRFLSPLLGPRCRFVPSCSEYAVEALQRHGALRGLRLMAWRLLRCQPFCRGGYDQVPPARARAAKGMPTAGDRGAPAPAGEVPRSVSAFGSSRSVARPARKDRHVRHNGAHGGRSEAATADRGMGPAGASGPPGRGDSSC